MGYPEQDVFYERAAEALEKIAKNTTPPEQVNNIELMQIHQFYYNRLMNATSDDMNQMERAKIIRDLIGKSAQEIEKLYEAGRK
jgi:hypothetical protein